MSITYGSVEEDFDNHETFKKHRKPRWNTFVQTSHLALIGICFLLILSLIWLNSHSIALVPINAARLPTEDIHRLFEEGKIESIFVNGAPESQTLHHTERYRFKDLAPLLVFRRGWPFIVNFTVPGKGSADDTVDVYLTNQLQNLAANITGKILTVEHQGSDVTAYSLELNTSSKSPILDFNLTMCFSANNNDTDLRCFRSIPVVMLLFNPYNSEDQVFMEELGTPVLLPEYIENEYGAIWRGSLDDMQPMRWYYAQFDEYVVHTLLYLMQNFTDDRSNAVPISRYLTYVLNAGDTGIPNSPKHSAPSGLILGRWFGNYSDGELPENWMASNSIYKKYWEQKNTVKYAQCWIYAAVMNTALRALGIPARQLVTFNSAHESPRGVGWFSHVINRYYDAKTGKLINMDGTVWNFHSWNDAWMKRPDLGKVYDGWQAVDATPQETSRNKYQCGPSPVYAIHEMEDEVEYDVSFLISEVSARVHRYTGTCHGSWEGRHCTRDEDLGFIPVYQSLVAALIATPAPGSKGDTISDVSELYHPPLPVNPNSTTSDNDTDTDTDNNSAPSETTPPTLPPVSSLPALTPLTLDSPPRDHLNGDCSVALEVTCDLIGEPIQAKATFKCKKNSKSAYTIEYHVNGYFSDYTLRHLFDLDSKEGKVTLDSSNNFWAVENVSFPFEDYYKKDPIVQTYSFDVFARVAETGQVLMETDTIDLRDPPITISAPPVITIPKDASKDSLKSYTATFSFRNSLPIQLTSCRMTIQAVNMGLDVQVDVPKIPRSGGGSIVHKEQFTPTSDFTGLNCILASMSCAEISDLHGDTDVQVIVR